MTTMISTPAKKAGVECPKETGKMKKEASCTECEYYAKCYSAVMSALGL